MKRRGIAVVLVEPRGDANIGAVARAMKNFGIRDLRLVNSVDHRTKTAYMWAVDARDLLDQATTYASLDAALADASSALAFTRRLGRARKRHMTLSEAAPWIVSKARRAGIALVFGREDKGLSNEEIRRCDAIVSVPTSDELPSLNLAQSVVIAGYEIFNCPPDKKRAASLAYAGRPSDENTQKFVARREIDGVVKRLSAMLVALGYYNDTRTHLKSRILHQLERLFGRGGLTNRDVRMFEGLSQRIIAKNADSSKGPGKKRECRRGPTRNGS